MIIGCTFNFYLHDEVEIEALKQRMLTLENKGKEIMATIEQVILAAQEEKDQVAAALLVLQNQIVELQAQIAAGTAATPEQLDALITVIQGIYAAPVVETPVE